MNELKLTGGARIGSANATFPFATLIVNRDRLELNASIIGNLVFQPDDIISIEPYPVVSFFGGGVIINHKVATYKKEIVFWTFKDPNAVIGQIKQTGFLSNTNASNQNSKKLIRERQLQGGFPLKKSFAIGAVVLWNLFFLLDLFQFLNGNVMVLPLGAGVLSALGLLFCAAFLMLFSYEFRKMALKEGRELRHVKSFIYFALFISAFMFLGFSIIIKSM